MIAQIFIDLMFHGLYIVVNWRRKGELKCYSLYKTILFCDPNDEMSLRKTQDGKERVVNYIQGRMHVPRAGGQASSEGTSMYMHTPPQG